jgi:CRP-like cAMP-binding protein
MALEHDIGWLERHDLLSLLPREALRLLAFAAETRILRAGDILFRRGDIADGGYIVLSGRIALDARDDGAPAQDVVEAGALIGEIALFSQIERPATAVARESATVMKLPRTVMLRVLGEFPEGAAAVHRAIAARVTAFSDQIAPARLLLTGGDVTDRA